MTPMLKQKSTSTIRLMRCSQTGAGAWSPALSDEGASWSLNNGRCEIMLLSTVAGYGIRCQSKRRRTQTALGGVATENLTALQCPESLVRCTIDRAFSPRLCAATVPGAAPQAGIERAVGPWALCRIGIWGWASQAVGPW